MYDLRAPFLVTFSLIARPVERIISLGWLKSESKRLFFNFLPGSSYYLCSWIKVLYGLNKRGSIP